MVLKVVSKQAITCYGNRFERIKVVERKVLHGCFVDSSMLNDIISPPNSTDKLHLSTSIMALEVFMDGLPNKILGVLGVHDLWVSRM